MQAHFTRFDNEDNWVQGKAGMYSFDAKLFNDPSMYGIDGGRVSKLSISSLHGMIVANYDRGWDIEPNEEILDYFDAVMELLENSEERDFDK